MVQQLSWTGAEQSQDVLHAVLSESQDCIKLVTPGGDIEYINDYGMRALQLDTFAEATAHPWSKLWPEENRAQVSDSVARASKGHRNRFEAFRPSKGGRGKWWDVSVSPVYDDEGDVSRLLVISREVTEQVHRRLNDRLRREEAEREADHASDIAREMRHRLKNQLAVVASVTKLLARNSDSADELCGKVENKLFALAQAQDLLTVHREAPIGSREAVEEVLSASGAGERIEVTGIPDMPVGDDTMQQIALVLGELQTNSLKYGALSARGGKITLTGSVTRGMLTLVWHEDVARDFVDPEGKTGAGMRLIERLGSASGARGSVAWHSSGPLATLHFRVLED